MSITTMLTRNVARALLSNQRFLTRVPESVSSERSVYLTFDDGPDIEQTPAVLDHLASLDAKATFFVLGNKIANGAGLVRRIVEDGHGIGSHGWGHLDATDVSSSAWLADADRGIAELEEATGQECCLFRPAYGNLTPLTLIGLLRRDLRVVLWTQDVRDYLTSSPDELYNWFQQNEPFPGSIVLMHDNHPTTGTYLAGGLRIWSGDVTFTAMQGTGPS